MNLGGGRGAKQRWKRAAAGLGTPNQSLQDATGVLNGVLGAGVVEQCSSCDQSILGQQLSQT